jgi:hypothetical protein
VSAADANAAGRPAAWPALAMPGSALQLALIRLLVAVHLVTVFTSPALPLLARIGGAPHPMAGTHVPRALEALLSWQHVLWIAHVGAVAAVAMALGVATRLAVGVVLVAFLITQNYWFRATVFHDDWLYFVFPLMVLLFSRCSDRLSVDALLRRKPPLAGDARAAYRWPVELIVAWFAFLYVAAGLAKLLPLRKGVLWLSGRSVQHFATEFLHDSPVYWVLGRSAFDHCILWPFTLASVATVALELGAGALPFLSKARPLLFLALLGMHASIWSLGIPGFVQIALTFSAAMLPARLFRDGRG